MIGYKIKVTNMYMLTVLDIVGIDKLQFVGAKRTPNAAYYKIDLTIKNHQRRKFYVA